MKKYNVLISGLLCLIATQTTYAEPDKAQLAVWANEAIIATYTFDYKNLIQEQKEIGKYFTSTGWIAYNKALNESKLLDAVQKNDYAVTSVATQPPVLTTIDPTHWQVTMPILVVYKNPQYQQQQNLNVVLKFTSAPAGQGVRGLAITSLKSTVTKPPCRCQNEENTTNPNTVKK